MGEIKKTFEIIEPTGPHDHPCNGCGRSTKHRVISAFQERGSQDCGGGNSFDWHVRYEIIQCQGCEEVSFRKASTNSEDWDFDNNGDTIEYQETVAYFPVRSGHTGKIEPYTLPLNISSIYIETKGAIDNGLSVLAAVGIRTIIEAVCNDLGVHERNLAEKIDSLRDQGKVTPDGAKLLHTLRGLGNDATHKVAQQPTEHLLLAMKVIDHLLEATYIIPPAMERVFGKPAATSG
jgi:hypothetical protein